MIITFAFICVNEMGDLDMCMADSHVGKCSFGDGLVVNRNVHTIDLSLCLRFHQVTGRGGGHGAAGGSALGAAAPHQEVISRAQINDALDAVVGLLPGGPAATPAQGSGPSAGDNAGAAAVGGASADDDGDDAMSDAATMGSTAEDPEGMDTTTADEAPAGSTGGMDVDAPPPAGAERYEEQLGVLRAMGFEDEAAWYVYCVRWMGIWRWPIVGHPMHPELYVQKCPR